MRFRFFDRTGSLDLPLEIDEPAFVVGSSSYSSLSSWLGIVIGREIYFTGDLDLALAAVGLREREILVFLAVEALINNYIQQPIHKLDNAPLFG